EIGADEVDMVLNIGALKDNKMDYVINEIKAIKEAVGTHVLKVIIETCLLTDEEKVRACEAVVKAGADFVKTSTGFSTSGATVEDVRLMKATVKDQCKVKAAGGVRSYDDLLQMIEAGAERIGTSSGCALLQGKNIENNVY
ncbi:deoxyribose-phosphate aldolase, partial [Anaerorhabdus sp.]